jgi:hypothetical protein
MPEATMASRDPSSPTAIAAALASATSTLPCSTSTSRSAMSAMPTTPVRTMPSAL